MGKDCQNYMYNKGGNAQVVNAKIEKKDSSCPILATNKTVVPLDHAQN